MDGMNPLVSRLAALGRGNDSIVAHINPREAMILKMLGGSGAINPLTGLPEFDDGGASDSGQNGIIGAPTPKPWQDLQPTLLPGYQVTPDKLYTNPDTGHVTNIYGAMDPNTDASRAFVIQEQYGPNAPAGAVPLDPSHFNDLYLQSLRLADNIPGASGIAPPIGPYDSPFNATKDNPYYSVNDQGYATFTPQGHEAWGSYNDQMTHFLTENAKKNNSGLAGALGNMKPWQGLAGIASLAAGGILGPALSGAVGGALGSVSPGLSELAGSISSITSNPLVTALQIASNPLKAKFG